MIITGNSVLDNELSKISKNIIEINKRIDAMYQLFSSTATISDLRVLKKELDNKSQATSTLVRELESRLNMIKTPEETRFYLSESEIEDFRKNFTKLITMVADINDTYVQLTTYMSSK